jgi:glycine hydroxymethyltransferase
MTQLARRDWVPPSCEDFIQRIAARVSAETSVQAAQRLDELIAANRRIHEQDCVNLNPATNVMNPNAEAALSQGLGSRPSLGYPGDKYEMGLEAIEEIEVIAAELAAEIFNARHAEIRVGSGALANLYAFMATCRPGDTIIVPPPEIGGHVTHHDAGAAGLYGLKIHAAPFDASRYSIDIDALARLARQVRPKLITLGGSLNLLPHPVREVRQIADDVGAVLLFDAAHLCGMIAGKAWPNPLDEGAHLMSMSTYKSLGGPAGGLLLTNEAELARKIDAIAFPGLTANFDVGKTAALAITLLDWREHGRDYAAMMAGTARALAEALRDHGVPVFETEGGPTTSHQFAISARVYGGGQTASKKLRAANLLACGIGLPIKPVEGDLNGLRIGTPEIVRWGMRDEHMPELARLIAAGLQANEPSTVASQVTAFRKPFQKIHYIRH